MQKLSLEAVAREQLDRAKAGDAGRSATTVVGGHEQVLRQTVIALTEGTVLSEHENPGEATVHVIDGRVRLLAGDPVGSVTWDGRSGDLLVVPPERHQVEAVEDAVILLTVAKRE